MWFIAFINLFIVLEIFTISIKQIYWFQTKLIGYKEGNRTHFKGLSHNIHNNNVKLQKITSKDDGALLKHIEVWHPYQGYQKYYCSCSHCN